ncbi:phosphotyrosyl phosphatase activator [Elsinoe ampelina]|uniref:Serine/threonine-protein phosphatase 2A activator n=1 Tax=Elsinoe ampelina TaxID=302913 RepID=A0A6A6GFN7_9PEZI|nr:phosphotyrosyl phosphatase activator [Elsinoe ampelina]
MSEDVRNNRGLRRLDLGEQITPEEPKKRINEGDDLSFFLTSKAYVDIVTFIGQLNRSMFPLAQSDGRVRSWTTHSTNITLSPEVGKIKELVRTLSTILDETPPETGPRRFGNAAFRTWYRKVEERTPALLQQALPDQIWKHSQDEAQETLQKELGEYFLGSFGSPERLDYGTGHELSFLAFLGGIWKLNGFASSENGEQERSIVFGIIEPYLVLIRKLILAYTLEPAGSHGVWGLDDHSFAPYILGSAQLSPAVSPGSLPPMEGSLKGAPRPGDVVKETAVRRLSEENLYFSAIAFIYDVKKGPFWEHSPTLYDISGIKAGWAKINKGLMKMYNAEVLSKFPVVQHLRFGSLFRWETDPSATPTATTVHARSQPPATGTTRLPTNPGNPSSTMPPIPTSSGAIGTAAPWARAPPPSNGSFAMPTMPAGSGGNLRGLPSQASQDRVPAMNGNRRPG